MPTATSRSQSQLSKIHPDRPVHPNLEEYLTIKTACFPSYHDTHDDHLAAQLKEWADYPSIWPLDALLGLWRGGEPQAVLEIAVRYASTVSRLLERYVLPSLSAVSFDAASSDI